MTTQEIHRETRLAYLDYFSEAVELAIRSPFHYLIFDEALSPLVQALTLKEILALHPTDANRCKRVWSCENIADFAAMKQRAWSAQGSRVKAMTAMLYVPPLDDNGWREAGTIEEIYRNLHH